MLLLLGLGGLLLVLALLFLYFGLRRPDRIVCDRLGRKVRFETARKSKRRVLAFDELARVELVSEVRRMGADLGRVHAVHLQTRSGEAIEVDVATDVEQMIRLAASLRRITELPSPFFVSRFSRDRIPRERAVEMHVMNRARCRRVLLPISLALVAFAAPAAGECHRIYDCELVWSDEFEGSALDPDKWEPQIGDGTNVGLPAGWGNNELQYYRAENATVAGGLLTITAREEQVGGYSYTSARLRTRGKGDWRYGRMEMRARMPIGQGLWPAFWMLPSVPSLYGTWAASGEIDIMEYLGSDPNRVSGTIHYGAPWPNNAFSASEYVLRNGSFDRDFHVFAVEWERGEIRWYVDDVHYATRREWYSTGGPYPAPFDVDFHLLLNLAVGGNLPGSPDETTSFPQELVVDYVRVYQSAAAKGSQVGRTDLAFEKRIAMKKIEASLTMSFENQARPRDRLADPRRVWCSVTTRGTRAARVAKGELRLRLTGIDPAPWESRALQAALGADGSVIFGEDEIGQLVDEATAAGATIRDFEVTFDGRRGGKVTELTLDCMQAPVTE